MVPEIENPTHIMVSIHRLLIASNRLYIYTSDIASGEVLGSRLQINILIVKYSSLTTRATLLNTLTSFRNLHTIHICNNDESLCAFIY